MNNTEGPGISRRDFLATVGRHAAAFGLGGAAALGAGSSPGAPPAKRPRPHEKRYERKKHKMKVTIATACVPDLRGQSEQNFAAASSLVRQLAQKGAQIVVLPESALQGYPMEDERFSMEQLREMAEPIDGKYAQGFRTLAKDAGVYLVAAYDRRDGKDFYNTAELIGPDGKTIGLYNKTHTFNPGATRGFYTRGKALPVFDTDFGKVGLLICLDRTFPESWRVLMLQGANMILVPANGGYTEGNTRRFQVLAASNRLCAAFAHSKRGLVIDVDGEIVDRDKDAEKPYAIGEVDLSEVALRQEQLREIRRPDLYGPITKEK